MRRNTTPRTILRPYGLESGGIISRTERRRRRVLNRWRAYFVGWKSSPAVVARPAKPWISLGMMILVA